MIVVKHELCSHIYPFCMHEFMLFMLIVSVLNDNLLNFDGEVNFEKN